MIASESAQGRRRSSAQVHGCSTSTGRTNQSKDNSCRFRREQTMGTPYLSEIRIVSFNFAAKGWALTNGQLLPINQNQALFSILGTTYGGDGRQTFALPDLRGRVAIHE